jgi:hypothetical protein
VLQYCFNSFVIQNSFNKLCSSFFPKLHLNEKFAIVTGLEPISCEIMLHYLICFLAGGSYRDICATAFIGRPSFFRLLWHAIDAINICDALEVPLPRLDQLPQLHEGFKKVSYS